MATITKYPVNRWNFIRWRKLQGATWPFGEVSYLVDYAGNFLTDYSGNRLVDYPTGSGFTIADPATPSPWLSNAYAWPAGMDLAYRPVFAVGEEVGFYVNIREDLTAYRVAFVPAETHAVKYEVSGTYTNLGGFQGFAVPSMPSGYYNLILIDANSNVGFMSNPIEVMQQTEYGMNDTMLLAYSHNRDMYDYLFRQYDQRPYRLRLHLNRTEYNPSGELKQYVEISTGKRRTSQMRLEKGVTIETRSFDEPAHEAMMLLPYCANIWLNDRPFAPKSLYNVENNKFDPLTNGTIELMDLEFAQANIQCSC